MLLFELDKEVSNLDAYAQMAEANGLNLDATATMDLVRVADRIKRECQPFLQQAGNRVLWRGLDMNQYDGATILMKDIRLEGRRPTDTKDELHNILNKAFTEKFGEPFRDAMFATGNKADTTRYGLPFHAFPIGDFRFIWSPTVKDLWVSTRALRSIEMMPAAHYNEEEIAQAKARAEDDLTKTVIPSYKNTNLELAIKSKSEIMIRGASYYAINFDNLAKEHGEGVRDPGMLEYHKIKTAMQETLYRIISSK